MRNEIGFTALVCALGMGTLAGCGTEDPGAAGEPLESVQSAIGLGQACTVNNPGVAASSVTGANTPDKAIDGNTKTRWESQQGVDPQWIRIDLGGAVPITGVTLNWEPACAKDYTIQTSNDATNWATVFTVTGNTTAGVKTHNFTKTAQFVRMNGTKRCTTFGYSLWEFQVNTAPLKVVQCNLDNDHDGFGGGYLFCGGCPQATVGSSNDCNDGNPTAKPGQPLWFRTPMTFSNSSGTSFDWNCDGIINWRTTSGWQDTDGVFSACTNAAGQRVDDCSQCVYNFTPVDASDCGHHRCSLGAGDVYVECH
jgi:hypothetical protein